ncbi:MAG: PEP-CTERM sorting domain-containing protein [Phycisphaerales bacterium]|nr:PEP-CTERM sorting domain-containing protein [Phycisphaerales bacterium]
MNWTNDLPTDMRLAYIRNGTYADVTYGTAAAGLLDINDGGLLLDGTGQLDIGILQIARDGASVFDLGGLGVLDCGSLTLGIDGLGTFNQTGGVNTVTGALNIATDRGGSGSTYNLSAGQLSVQALGLGVKREAYFNQSGGVHRVTGQAMLTKGSHYTLSGGQFIAENGIELDYGKLAWYGGTLDTPEISFAGGSSYLSLGANVDFHQLANGALPNGTLLTNFELACISLGGDATMNHNAGMVSMGRDLLLGNSSGSYTLNITGAGELQTIHYVHVGYEGRGALTLSDSAQLTTDQVHVGTDVIGDTSPGQIGVVTHDGGRLEAARLSVMRGPSDGSPAYDLRGTGQLTTGSSTIGSGASPNPGTSNSPIVTHEALFRQSGGRHETNNLYVGRFSSNSIGAYELTGGLLEADVVKVGHPSYSPFQVYPGSVGRFSQSGGTLTARTLEVSSVSRYEFTGGVCQFDDATIEGEFDFLGSNASLVFTDGIMNFSQGKILNGSNASIDAGNTLLIVPPTFDPYSDLGGFTTNGVVHHAGATLIVPAGKLVVGGGEIDDYVECQGSLVARPEGSLSLNSGLFVSDEGTVELGSGELVVADQTSGISGGSISATDATVGLLPGPDSKFTQTGGNVTLGGLMLGDFNDTNATYELHEGQLTVTRRVQVCRIGHATFRQSGGALVTPALTVLDRYELSGGSIECGYLMLGDSQDDFMPEYSRSGKFIHSGGTIAATGEGVWVGYQNDTAIYELSGKGRISTTNLLVRAQFVQNGGTVLVDDRLGIEPAYGAGKYLLNAGTLSSGRELIEDRGVFQQTGGVHNIANGIMVGGYNLGGTSGVGDPTYDMQGGDCKIEGRTWVFNRNGGDAYFRLSNAASLETEELLVADNGYFQQSGGSHQAEYIRLSNGGSYSYTAGTLEITRALAGEGVFDFGDSNVILYIEQGASANFSQIAILGAGNANIRAKADSLLNFAADFNPLTDLGGFHTQGLVHVAGEVLIIPPGSTIHAGGKLAGGVQNRGRLRPGHSPGILDVEGDYEQLSGGALQIELSGSDNSDPENVQFDQVIITEQAVLAGALEIVLLDGYVPQSDQFGVFPTFEILNYDSYVGEFDTISGLNIGNGFGFVVTYQSDSIILSVEPIPEPASILLTGCGALVVLRRRKRSR